MPMGKFFDEVNGVDVHTLDLTDIYFKGDSKVSSGATNSGFINISAAQTATGSNGIVADYTKWWRTGQFVVAPGDQRNGWTRP